MDGKPVHNVDGLPTIIESVHGSYAYGFMVQKGLTLKPCFIAKMGDCFAHGDTLRDAMTDVRSKYEENLPLEEKFNNFVAAFPTLDTKATGRDFYSWHHTLTGSCRAGRDQFCRECGVDLDAEYTVGYFLDLVKDAFGSDNIREVMKRYEAR